ncbi:hypothetical protein [uncultured Eubacterium sp.]|nr:hypothetical protein [uncultured Eubacterium sp.]
MRKWYKGDTHLHTTNSDGNMTPEKLIDASREAGATISLNHLTKI